MSEKISLNKEQQKAAFYGEGPLLIVAGAGTGKTTVITERFCWLAINQKVPADRILALTFTEKAATEMEERIDKLLPYGYLDLWISTFHSFCQKILEAHAVDIGLPTDFKMLNQTGQWLLIQKNLERFNLDYYKPAGNPTKFVHALMRLFSRAKDETLEPKDFLHYAEELKLNTDSGNFLSQILSKEEQETLSKKELKELAAQEINKINEVADAYHQYQQLLLENDAMDFGDLINYTLKLFKSRPRILAQYRSKFKFILVDEFQDTNWAQYELIKILAASKNNLTVVGDDDQCLLPDAKINTKNGMKPIKNIKAGDLVLTAVGRGYFSYGRVNKIFKNKKSCKFITFKTAKGYELKVTDNHKLFCLAPAVDDRKYYFVYLMQRQGLGWRIGITNDICARLRQERSADKVIAIKSCKNEEEARYYETLYSLKYNIPTICFGDRNGIARKSQWLKRLFSEIDTQKNAEKMAQEINIDLNSHHYSLGAVNRGEKLRVKINLELCHRRHKTKSAKKNLLQKPLIKHLLSVETFDHETIKKLKSAGYNLKKSKKGFRLRMASADLAKLGKMAIDLEKITGGIIENSFKIGKTNIQTKKALVMPAKNVMMGNYLPIIIGEQIIYDRVIEKKESQNKIAEVYDLEVDKTHNFAANGVIVHNSVYKFRGASVSNILQFKKDYPVAKEVFLVKNYRSCQNILDLAYNFIQLNNPERLEVKLAKAGGPCKKLESQLDCIAPIKYLKAETGEEEAIAVINKIIEIKNSDPGLSWSDFAILVRANDHADDFNYALNKLNIPFQFVASRGLYNKAVVLDMMAYLKLLDNYHESPAVYRVLSLPIFGFSQRELVNLNYWAKRKALSLYQVLLQAAGIDNIEAATLKKISQVIGLIEKHTALVKDKSAREVVLGFLEDSGYLKELTKTDSLANQQAVSYLNQFYKKIVEFENNTDFASVKSFVELIDLEIRAGEQGSLLSEAEEGPDSIKVMTIHAAKGLEFKYVFVVNMVDRRFPTTNRSDQIAIPDSLIKETLPSGDVHLQEERRLFYVACTRAKLGLYFSGAKSYGGGREKKPSKFLYEINLAEEKKEKSKKKISNEEKIKSEIAENGKSKPGIGKKEYYRMPARFSFSQLKAYETCPWQYRFAFILRVPIGGKKEFSFGKTIHSTFQKIISQAMTKKAAVQQGLFGNAKEVSGKKPLGELISLEEINKFYEESWIDDWYETARQKEEYFKKGKNLLKEYYDKFKEQIFTPLYLEKGFNVKIKNEKNNAIYTMYGVIDRVDEIEGGLEIIDYKTGKAKEKLTIDDKEQLLIYQLAGREVFDKPIKKLTFHYVEKNELKSFLGNEQDLEKIKAKIIFHITEIEKGEFAPKPGIMCQYCDFREICEHRAM